MSPSDLIFISFPEFPDLSWELRDGDDKTIGGDAGGNNVRGYGVGVRCDTARYLRLRRRVRGVRPHFTTRVLAGLAGLVGVSGVSISSMLILTRLLSSLFLFLFLRLLFRFFFFVVKLNIFGLYVLL
jgi:hypothetical protein